MTPISDSRDSKYDPQIRKRLYKELLRFGKEGMSAKVYRVISTIVWWPGFDMGEKSWLPH